LPESEGWNFVHLSTACVRACLGLHTVAELDRPCRAAGDILAGRGGGSGGPEDAGGGQSGAVEAIGHGGGGGHGGEDMGII